MVTVVVLVAVLVALGVTLTVMGIHLVRATRTDPAALGPLEVMSERRWERGDPERRAEALAGARAAITGSAVAGSAVAEAEAAHTDAAEPADLAATAAVVEDESVGDETAADETAGVEPAGVETAEIAGASAAPSDESSPEPPEPQPEPPTPPAAARASTAGATRAAESTGTGPAGTRSATPTEASRTVASRARPTAGTDSPANSASPGTRSDPAAGAATANPTTTTDPAGRVVDRSGRRRTVTLTPVQHLRRQKAVASAVGLRMTMQFDSAERAVPGRCLTLRGSTGGRGLSWSCPATDHPALRECCRDSSSGLVSRTEPSAHRGHVPGNEVMGTVGAWPLSTSMRCWSASGSERRR